MADHKLNIQALNALVDNMAEQKAATEANAAKVAEGKAATEALSAEIAGLRSDMQALSAKIDQFNFTPSGKLIVTDGLI